MKRILILGSAVVALLACIVWANSARSVRSTVGFIRIGAYLHPVAGPSFQFHLTNETSYTVRGEVMWLESETPEGWRVATNFTPLTLPATVIVYSADYSFHLDPAQIAIISVPVQSAGARWRAVLRYRRVPKPRGAEDAARAIASQAGVRTDLPWFTNVSDTVTK